MGRWKCQTKRTYRLVPELKPIRPGAPGATPLTTKSSAAHALACKSTGGRESVRNRSAVPAHVCGGLPTRHAARRGDDGVGGDGDATVHDACLRAWRSDRNAQRRRDEKDEDEAHPVSILTSVPSGEPGCIGIGRVQASEEPAAKVSQHGVRCTARVVAAVVSNVRFATPVA